jgi:hypothetical protein
LGGPIIWVLLLLCTLQIALVVDKSRLRLGGFFAIWLLSEQHYAMEQSIFESMPLSAGLGATSNRCETVILLDGEPVDCANLTKLDPTVGNGVG